MGRDIVKGDVPALILAVLARGAAHGYAIARAIERESADVLRLREGTLYPALRQLEQQGLVTSEWEIQESGPARKIYQITETGKADLQQRAAAWHDYMAAVAALLNLRRFNHD